MRNLGTVLSPIEKSKCGGKGAEVDFGALWEFGWVYEWEKDWKIWKKKEREVICIELQKIKLKKKGRKSRKQKRKRRKFAGLIVEFFAEI